MPYTLTFRPSYGPADCRRALKLATYASLDELARFRTEVGIAHAKALRAASQATPRSRNVLVRAAAAWGGAVEETNARIRAASMTSLAASDARGDYDPPAICCTEKGPSMDPADEQPAPAEPPARRCIPGSMMAHAMGFLANCGKDGATPAQVWEAITLAGWKSAAGKTPKNTLRAALHTAAKHGKLALLPGSRYGLRKGA